MFKLFFIAALLVTWMGMPQAAERHRTTVDKYCQALAVFGHAVAEGRDQGYSRDYTLGLIAGAFERVTDDFYVVIDALYANPHVTADEAMPILYEECIKNYGGHRNEITL
jgi:hypothetical protein